MEKLAVSLANKISSSLGYDNEKEAVVAYGLIALIQVSATILLILVLGILLGVTGEALTICFAVAILRKYSGGVHAKTAELCTVVSVVYCVAMAIVAKKLLAGIYSSSLMLAAIILIFGISFWIAYRRVPVDSPNKPIKTEKKIRRMRTGSFVILTAYLIISVLLYVFASRHGGLKAYGICLLFGLSWQVFTLTKSGAILLKILGLI